jgi:hypothetical protein
MEGRGGVGELETQLQDPSFHSFQSWFAVVTPRVRMNDTRKSTGQEQKKQTNKQTISCVSTEQREIVLDLIIHVNVQVLFDRGWTYYWWGIFFPFSSFLRDLKQLVK